MSFLCPVHRSAPSLSCSRIDISQSQSQSGDPYFNNYDPIWVFQEWKEPLPNARIFHVNPHPLCTARSRVGIVAKAERSSVVVANVQVAMDANMAIMVKVKVNGWSLPPGR